MSAWAAVMITPRGGLLDGYHAQLVNHAIYPTEALAQYRAERQKQFEDMRGNRVQIVVIELEGVES